MNNSIRGGNSKTNHLARAHLQRTHTLKKCAQWVLKWKATVREKTVHDGCYSVRAYRFSLMPMSVLFIWGRSTIIKLKDEIAPDGFMFGIDERDFFLYIFFLVCVLSCAFVVNGQTTFLKREPAPLESRTHTNNNKTTLRYRDRPID